MKDIWGDLLRSVPHIKNCVKINLQEYIDMNMNWFSTPIGETKHGNSYLDLPKYFWDFQILSVTQ